MERLILGNQKRWLQGIVQAFIEKRVRRIGVE